MGLDHLDHFGRFAALAGEGGARLRRVRADLVVQRLADVVQQAGAARQAGVELEFFGDHAGQRSNLHAVGEQALAVAGPETESTEQLEQGARQVVDAQVEGRLGGRLPDDLLDVFLGLLIDLLDAAGMDASIHDQLFQRVLGHLAAQRIEARQHHHTR